MKVEVTKEFLEKIYKEDRYLYYVDRNESFSENSEQVERAIRENSLDAVYDLCDEIGGENVWNEVEDIKKSKRKEIQKELNVSKEIAKEIISEYEDMIKDIIYDSDISTPSKDMISNTNKFIMFYDLGHEVTSDSWSWTEFEISKERNQIKKVIKLKSKDYDDMIDMMLRQASYGGQLVVYFRTNFEELITEEEVNEIQFSGDINLAIIDTRGGSGDHCEFKHEFKVQLNRDNLFLDKNIKYNYSYAVCGMVESWCDDTNVKLNVNKRLKKKTETSEINRLQEIEMKYKQSWKGGRGKCTFGDMDINRHKNASYENGFPAGNKCNKCGTFWID